jgi:N-acetylglucosaminyl-diphospho-decaprenol L-rhamnosyltransferase
VTARVRAVVVTWNGAHLLRPCLDSLLAQDLPDGELEILLVDNASTDGTADLIETAYPSVRVVALPENTGFAGGVAAGTADLLRTDADLATLPEYVVLLNNDAWFEPGAVRSLVTTADAAAAAGERVGAVTAKVLLAERDEHGRELINSTGNTLTPAGAAADRDFRVPVDEAHPQREVFGLYGGASLIRAAALRDAGGFDAGLFLYYEDTDLSFRLRACGWTVVYDDGAVARHRHSASSGTASPLFRYYNTRNSLIVVARYAPWTTVLRSVARQVLGAVRHTVLGTEPRKLVSARWKALGAFLIQSPRTLRHRRGAWRDSLRGRVRDTV